MPTYEYACTSCGHRFEVVQSFSDAALNTCPICEGPLRKVFGNVGIVLKGSGFYKTDSRSSRSSTNGSGGAKEHKDKDKEKEKESTSSSTKESGTPAKESTSGGSSAPAPAPAAASNP